MFKVQTDSTINARVIGLYYSIQEIAAQVTPRNGRWQDLTIIDTERNVYVSPREVALCAEAPINVNFYTTGNGKRRASIIASGEALYMSRKDALAWLNGKRYTVGPHTNEARRRCGRMQ